MTITVDYGRAGTKAARTRQVVHELLFDKASHGEVPTNVRFVFYELEQRGDAVKASGDDTRKNSRRSLGWPPGYQDIVDALMWLRDQGIVPWNWIEDESRQVTIWDHAPSVYDYMLDRLAEATVNPWGDSPPLILCESRATAGVLRRTCSEYVCPITGTGGQVGGFLRTGIGPLLRDGREVLYIGDLDKSGGDIEANTRRVLEEVARHSIDWRRIAITEAQAVGIEPVVKRDGRTNKVGECWEAETLGQAPLADLVREALDDILPEPLGCVHEREEEQRGELHALLVDLDGRP